MTINKDELIKAVDDIREVLPIIARQMRAYYNELIATGFSTNQALKIVIAHGLYPSGINGK